MKKIGRLFTILTGLVVVALIAYLPLLLQTALALVTTDTDISNSFRHHLLPFQHPILTPFGFSMTMT